jgi:hypothetical protein
MNRRDQTPSESNVGTGSEDLRDERVRALYAAAYPAAYPSTEPSQELERRVAALAAQHDARSSRSQAGWLLSPRWRSGAGAMAAAALIVALGLKLATRNHRQVTVVSGHSGAIASHPPRNAPGSQRLPLAPKIDRDTRIADQRAFPAKTRDKEPAVPRERLEPPRPAMRRLDDMAYLNSDPKDVDRPWASLPPDEWARIEAQVRSRVRVKDDFVTVPFQRLAGAAPRLIANAAESYKRQAAVVDARLTREVTLACKGMAFSDLCDQLRHDTGIELSAGPSAADEKVTIFCEKRPLRDIMREINRVFSFTWLRSGRPGAFKYELEQDLKSQLLEEELRNRDRDATLLALDAEMQKFRPYVGMSLDELRRRWDQIPEEQRRHLAEQSEDDEGKRLWEMAATGGWGGVQLYHRLTPHDRAALMAGQELLYRPDASDPDRRLPEGWDHELLSTTTLDVSIDGHPTPLAQAPGFRVDQLRLKLNLSELGQASLDLRLWASSSDPRRAGQRWCSVDPGLVTARSPSAAKPDNAAANARLRGRSPFGQMASLRPKASCPAEGKFQPGNYSGNFDRVFPLAEPHVFTADVWEAVHRVSGLPIVADYYTHLYPLSRMTVERQPLFEALCRVGDTLGVRWHQDGDFLVCRSTRYFWDRLQEVPNRYLQRWAQERDASHGLPLEALLEMAGMTEQQLDADAVAEGIEHFWGLREWAWVRDMAARYEARCLSLLTPEQLSRAQEPDGLRFAQLRPCQQQSIIRLQYEKEAAIERQEGPSATFRSPEEYARASITAFYFPTGWYLVLLPPESAPEGSWDGPWSYAGGRTEAEAIAAARRRYPRSSRQKVRLLRDGFFNAGL